MKLSNQSKLYEFIIVTLLSICILTVTFFPAIFKGQIIYLEDPPGSDSLDHNVTRRCLAVQSLLSQREFPLWEPRIGCGTPLFAESEAGIFHPTILLFFTNNLTWATNLTVLSAILLAMLGSYFWCRCLGLEALPSGAAALTYGLAAVFLGQTQALNIIHISALLPVSLALIYLGVTKKTKLVWFGLITVWTLQLLASHFETFAICQICCWIYILWLTFSDTKKSMPKHKIIILSLLSLLFTVLLGSVQLLSTYEFSQQSTRKNAAKLEWLKYTSTDIAPRRFVDPFLPIDEPGQENLLKKFYLDNNKQYIGWTALLLCICSFLSVKRSKTVISFWVTALFFFIASLGPKFGIYYLIWRYIPLMASFRFPNRYTIPMICLLAVLAAIGCQNINNLLKKHYSPRTANLALTVLLICLCSERIWLSFQIQAYLPQSWSSPPSVLSYITKPQRLFSMYSYTQNLIDIHNNQSAKQRQNIMWRHRSLLSPGMVPIWDKEAPDDYLFYSGGIVPSVSAGLQKAIHSLADDIVNASPQQVNSLAPYYDDWLKIFGITHLISPIPLPESWPKSEFSNVCSVPIAEIPGEHVFVYTLANPVKKIRLVPHLQRTLPANALNLETLSGPGDNNTLFALGIVDSGSLYEPDLSRPADIGRVTVERETNNTLIINTACDQDAYLVVSNTYDKNWQAAVDGKPVKIQLTNLALQSLPVPQGQHRIELRYISPAFEWGWKISLAALVLFLASAAYFTAKSGAAQTLKQNRAGQPGKEK